MNILILTHGIAPDKIGGSETQTLGLAAELAKNHRVTVITRPFRNLPRIERKKGFLIKRMGVRHFLPFPIFSYVFPLFLEISLRRKETDIIFTKSTFYGLIASVFQKILGIPAVTLIEGEQEYRAPDLITQFILHVVSRTIPMIVQTETIKEEVLKRTGKECPVIPNGIYLSPNRAQGQAVIYVGRLVRDKWNDKGIRHLIEAVRDTDLETLIIGGGPERLRLQMMARDAKGVRFLGPVSPESVPEHLKRGFVLVLPSLYGEGFPNVVIEAMSVGLPVIATRSGGVSDVVEHQKTGFLVEPADSSEIKRHILKLKNDRRLRKEMSENCLKEVQRYRWSVVAGQFAACFEEVIAHYPRRRRLETS